MFSPFLVRTFLFPAPSFNLVKPASGKISSPLSSFVQPVLPKRNFLLTIVQSYTSSVTSLVLLRLFNLIFEAGLHAEASFFNIKKPGKIAE